MKWKKTARKIKELARKLTGRERKIRSLRTTLLSQKIFERTMRGLLQYYNDEEMRTLRAIRRHYGLSNSEINTLLGFTVIGPRKTARLNTNSIEVKAIIERFPWRPESQNKLVKYVELLKIVREQSIPDAEAKISQYREKRKEIFSMIQALRKKKPYKGE